MMTFGYVSVVMQANVGMQLKIRDIRPASVLQTISFFEYPLQLTCWRARAHSWLPINTPRQFYQELSRKWRTSVQQPGTQNVLIYRDNASPHKRRTVIQCLDERDFHVYLFGWFSVCLTVQTSPRAACGCSLLRRACQLHGFLMLARPLKSVISELLSVYQSNYHRDFTDSSADSTRKSAQMECPRFIKIYLTIIVLSTFDHSFQNIPRRPIMAYNI